jgi:hypothetical protein
MQATLTGYVRYTKNNAGTAIESWWYDAVAKAFDAQVGWQYGVSSGATDYQRNLFFQFSIPVQLIGTLFSSLTTVYRQWDYDYIATPSGLAAALVSAQNWVPWEGRIQTVADSVNGAQDLDKKWNVANALPACASMAALPKSIVYDIERGRKSINLGSPARTDFGSLAARFRRSPKDNIVYL